ncbi:MAG: enoyl-CoA hydratase/isomerase family protein [Actinomycetes bacterium]
MTEFETLLYEQDQGVAWVTLNRPDAYNAFTPTMQRELATLWNDLKTNDDVHCIVLTGSGEKAFCTGIDRTSIATGDGFAFDPFTYDDPGRQLGPKSNGLWKPVIAAVNGMACGGAFYFLGEVEFVIAADHATFFDPHVTYGMAAVYEPILMSRRMPFGEVMRMSLLGNHERISAQRAFDIGLVSQVVPAGELHDVAAWAAQAIASQPPRAVQATVRSLWAARDLSTQQAIDLGGALLNLGIDQRDLDDGQAQFSSGARIEWRTR